MVQIAHAVTGVAQALKGASLDSLKMPALGSWDKLSAELPGYAQQFGLGTQGQYLMESLRGATGNAADVIRGQLDQAVFRASLQNVAPIATGAVLLHMAFDAALYRRDRFYL